MCIAQYSVSGHVRTTIVDDPMMRKMRDVKKPIVAATNGNVFAGGFLLPLNSDIRVGEVKDHLPCGDPFLIKRVLLSMEIKIWNGRQK